MKKINQQKTKYILHRHCKIASSNTSRLEAHAGFFRLLTPKPTEDFEYKKIPAS